jgi:heparin/heparan-sulfate lyase
MFVNHLKIKNVIFRKLISKILPVTLSILMFPSGLSSQVHAGYVDPYKTDADTSFSGNFVYPPLTERNGKGLNVPVPPKEHPRLFFREKDVPSLIKKMGNPLMSSCWQAIRANASIKTDGTLPRDVKQNMNAKMLNAIDAKALLYALQKDETMGKEAVDAIIQYNSTISFDHSKQDICRDVGRVILSTAMVYDWCYDLIAPADREMLIHKMEILGRQLEIVWPDLVQGSIVGHGSEAQLARDMLACGVAVFDEKPEIYNLAAGRIFAEFIPARKYFYPAAYHHQGSSYGPYRFVWDMWITMIFDKMGYPKVLGDDQAKVLYRWIYSRRPDGQFFRDGDDFLELFTNFGKTWAVAGAGIVGSYFNEPVLMGEAIDKKLIGKDPIFDFLFINPFLPEKNYLPELPLTKYFPAPLGAMIARTSWDEGVNSRAVVAEMKVGVYNYANHQHLDAGSFQIYYKGPLAINSGIYQGTTGGYGSEHFKNYYQRSIAHNTMLVYNPNEKFTWHGREVVNDGGQLFPNGGAEPRNMKEFLENDYKTGEVLAHAFGPDSLQPDFTYLKGEMAEAYSEKVKSFRRSFVFLNFKRTDVPAALIVFDRVVSSDGNYKKTWLLHCSEEPLISGNVTQVKRTEKGYKGQLVNTTLLPDARNLTINKVGGKDNEYEVGGKIFPQTAANDNNSVDGAIWRLEVSPKTASVDDLFLNVMQVMDYQGESKQALPVEKFDCGNFTGAKLGDRIVLFSKSGETNAQPISMTIKENGNFKVLITDVEPGMWTIEGKKIKPKTLKVEIGQNVILIDAVKGDFNIRKVK